MIDEVVRPELEVLLRRTLDEMIPKLAAEDQQVAAIGDFEVPMVATRPLRRTQPNVRRVAVAGLVAAACVAGLVGVATRDTDPAGSVLTTAAPSTTPLTTTSSLAASTVVAAPTSITPIVITSAPDHLLPTVFPAGFDDVVDDHSTGSEAGDVVRLFVTNDEHPAVLMVFISPTADPSSATDFTTITDETEDPRQPSFRLAVTLESGKRVLFASGGLGAAEVQQVADAMTNDPSSSGVLVPPLPRGLEEITWGNTQGTRADTITWSGPGAANITMIVGSRHGLDAIGNAISWPITAIDTPNGRAFVSVDRIDPTLVQVGVVVDGQAVNIEATGVSIADVTALAASIAPVTEEDWAARVP